MFLKVPNNVFYTCSKSAMETPEFCSKLTVKTQHDVMAMS